MNEPKKEAPKRQKQAAMVAKPEQIIYIGPNLPGGRLSQYKVFRGGIPPYLADLIAEKPEISDLIIPVAELTTAQALAKQVGTPENTAYKALSGADKEA